MCEIRHVRTHVQLSNNQSWEITFVLYEYLCYDKCIYPVEILVSISPDTTQDFLYIKYLSILFTLFGKYIFNIL